MSGLHQGDRIGGRYVLIDRLGVGGMGEVWLAELEGAGAFRRRVVIKMLAPERRGDARVAALDAVHEGFILYDNGDRSSLPAIAQALVALRYHARFLEQVEAWQSGKELEL